MAPLSIFSRSDLGGHNRQAYPLAHGDWSCRSFDVHGRFRVFNDLSRRAQALEGDERTNLEARFHMTRAVAGGQDAVDRILNWKRSPGDDAPSEDAAYDDGGPDGADVVD